MQIKVKTYVKPALEDVYARFDKRLFEALKPRFPKLSIERFDGNEAGSTVRLTLDFILVKQTWESLITYFHANETEVVFVDTGVIMPLGIKKWEHRHMVVKSQKGGTKIIDHIFYSSGFFLWDWMLYPVFLKMFKDRQPVYISYFNKKP